MGHQGNVLGEIYVNEIMGKNSKITTSHIGLIKHGVGLLKAMSYFSNNGSYRAMWHVPHGLCWDYDSGTL